MTGHALLDLLILATPAAFVAFWWTGARARELAVEHARRTCKKERVQFLDQSVALSGLSLERVRGGSIGVRRVFRFEFTDHADHRDIGTVTMSGPNLLSVDLPYTRDEEGNRIYRH